MGNKDLILAGEEIIALAYGKEKNYFKGTSAAAAHITGVIALMKSVNGDLSPVEIKGIIQKNSKKIRSLKFLSQTESIIDAGRCVKAAQQEVLEEVK